MHSEKARGPEPELHQRPGARRQPGSLRGGASSSPASSEVPSAEQDQVDGLARLTKLRDRRQRLLERLASGNRELEKLEETGALDRRYERWLGEWARILAEYEEVDDALKAWLDSELPSRS